MDGRILDSNSPQLKPPLPNLARLAAAGAVFTVNYNQSPQCVPSRSALMVGLRTDQIEVFDNFHGIVATDGNASNPDPHCVENLGREANRSAAWARARCIAIAETQKAPPTFIDRLATAGYNVTLWGKGHCGAGLSRFHGAIEEFPFSDGVGAKAAAKGKCAREWARGLGAEIDTKGTGQTPADQKWVVPDNLTRPALEEDYTAVSGCLTALRAGLFLESDPQFLYCSIIVPHPP